MYECMYVCMNACMHACTFDINILNPNRAIKIPRHPQPCTAREWLQDSALSKPSELYATCFQHQQPCKEPLPH